jgi:antitoxin component of RelBE/YafQ-DinJ toxin-antitoxin module
MQSKPKHPKSFRDAMARLSAKNILANIGIDVSTLPRHEELDSVAIEREEIVLPVDTRLRRTNQEIAEHEALTKWQLQRRLLKDKDQSNFEVFTLNA